MALTTSRRSVSGGRPPPGGGGHEGRGISHWARSGRACRPDGSGSWPSGVDARACVVAASAESARSAASRCARSSRATMRPSRCELFPDITGFQIPSQLDSFPLISRHPRRERGRPTVVVFRGAGGAPSAGPHSPDGRALAPSSESLGRKPVLLSGPAGSGGPVSSKWLASCGSSPRRHGPPSRVRSATRQEGGSAPEGLPFRLRLAPPSELGPPTDLSASKGFERGSAKVPRPTGRRSEGLDSEPCGVWYLSTILDIMSTMLFGDEPGERSETFGGIGKGTRPSVSKI
jgi:hypothetical protein